MLVHQSFSTHEGSSRLPRNSLDTTMHGRNWWPLPLLIAFYSTGNRREREEEGEVKWFPWGKGMGKGGGSKFFEAIFLHDHPIYIGVLFFLMSNMLYFLPLGERTKHDSIWQTSFRWLASQWTSPGERRKGNLLQYVARWDAYKHPIKKLEPVEGIFLEMISPLKIQTSRRLLKSDFWKASNSIWGKDFLLQQLQSLLGIWVTSSLVDQVLSGMVSWREFQHVPVGLFGLTVVFVDKLLRTLNFWTFTPLGTQYQKPRGGWIICYMGWFESQWITHHKPVAPCFWSGSHMSHVLTTCCRFHPFVKSFFLRSVYVTDPENYEACMFFLRRINWHQLTSMKKGSCGFHPATVVNKRQFFQILTKGPHD